MVILVFLTAYDGFSRYKHLILDADVTHVLLVLSLYIIYNYNKQITPERTFLISSIDSNFPPLHQINHLPALAVLLRRLGVGSHQLATLAPFSFFDLLSCSSVISTLHHEGEANPRHD